MTGPILTHFLYSKEKCKRVIIEYLIEVRAFSSERAIDIKSILRSLKDLPWRSALEDLVKSSIVIPVRKSVVNNVGVDINERLFFYLDEEGFTLYIEGIRLKMIVSFISLIALSFLLPFIGFIAGSLKTPPWELPLLGFLFVIALSIMGWMLMFPQYLVWVPYIFQRKNTGLP